MAKFQPSDFSTPRILSAEYRPRKWPWLLGVAALGAWSLGAFEMGRIYGSEIPPLLPFSEHRSTMERQIRALEQERDTLLERIASYEKDVKTSKVEDPAVTVAASPPKPLPLVAKRSEPPPAAQSSTISNSVEISEYSLSKLGSDERYRYRFTLLNQPAGLEKVEGSIEVAVVGEQGGKSRELTLPELTSNTVTSHRIGFKNFQKIQGTLSIPAEFSPKELVISVKPVTPGYDAFTNVFDWIWTQN